MPDFFVSLLSKNNDTEVRINQEVTLIVRRRPAAVIEVYRHGVLVWKGTRREESGGHVTMCLDYERNQT